MKNSISKPLIIFSSILGIFGLAALGVAGALMLNPFAPRENVKSMASIEKTKPSKQENTFIASTDEGADQTAAVANAGLPLTIEKMIWGKDKNGRLVDPTEAIFFAMRPEIFSHDGKKMLFESYSSNIIPDIDTGKTEQIYIKDIETGSYTLVSSKLVNGVVEAGETNSYNGSFSPDGTKVVFTTHADNLTGNDDNAYAYITQIAVKDLTKGTITTLSRRRAANNPGDLGNDTSMLGVFSPTGEYILFQSSATNLVESDKDSRSDIYLVRYTGAEDDYKTLTLISTDKEGNKAYTGELTNDPSFFFSTLDLGGQAVFAPDGQSVAFVSAAPLTGVKNRTLDVFIKKIPPDAIGKDKPEALASAVELASANADGEQGRSCTSVEPVFAPDGARLAFVSDCTEFVSEDTNSTLPDVFIKARKADGSWQNGEIELVSKDTEGEQGFFNAEGVEYAGGIVSHPTFSPDGTKIAFMSSYNKGAAIFSQSACTSCMGTQIYVKNITSPDGALALISVSKEGPTKGANGFSDIPLFDPSGKFIFFVSDSTDLVEEHKIKEQNIFRSTLPF